MAMTNGELRIAVCGTDFEINVWPRLGLHVDARSDVVLMIVAHDT